MQGPPPISIVIPCWNAERTIAAAIESALGQGVAGLEVIVVDDGSTDSSLDIIKSYDRAVRWLTGPNRGAAAARNAGLALARGAFVLFLDADDLIEPPLVAAFAELAARETCELAFGPFALVAQDGRRSPCRAPLDSETPERIFARVLSDQWVPLHSILWRADFVRAIGGWDEGMARNQDGEILTRALLQEPRIGFVREGCAVYVQHGGPARVSRRRDADALRCQLDYLALRGRQVAGTRFAHAGRPALADSAYALSRECYAKGEGALGGAALRLARELGLRGHQGSRAHRIAAGVLGLALKERLARFRHALTGHHARLDQAA